MGKIPCEQEHVLVPFSVKTTFRHRLVNVVYKNVLLLLLLLYTRIDDDDD